MLFNTKSAIFQPYHGHIILIPSQPVCSYSLREYDTVGIAKWIVHENSWFGQFRHALSKYAKKNIPLWLSFRDIYDRISTIFRQIFKIRIFIAVKKISQFQNGKR